MSRKHFLIGISAAALAAASASAQNNTATENCTGTNNTCVIDNNAVGNADNDAALGVVGNNNQARIFQAGDDNASVGTINGNDNVLDYNQSGDANIANGEIAGDDNRTEIGQRGEDNVATSWQNGDDNLSRTYQGSTAFDVSDNLATVRQDGSDNQSFVAQGSWDQGVGGSGNQAYVTQTGNTHISEVYQDSFDSAVPVPQIAADNNVATVVQAGDGGRSIINQANSSGNTAEVYIGGGAATGVGRNNSIIQQTNTFYSEGAGGEIVQGTPNSTNSVETGNVALVGILGQQNSSTVTQNGIRLTADVAMLQGGTGNTGTTPGAGPGGVTFPPDRPQGNTVEIGQNGVGHSAIVVAGGASVFPGQGNLMQIEQNGYSVAGGSVAGHEVLAWQRGILDTLTITQNNNGFAGGSQTGSVANVSQLSNNSTTEITQTGTNSASVTQGRNANGTGGSNTITISQTDAGDDVGPGTPGGPFNPGAPGAVTGRSNAVDVAQYGTTNTMSILQDAIDGAASVWQKAGGVDNEVIIDQLGGTANRSNFAGVEQEGARSTATISQGEFLGAVPGGSNNEARIIQAGNNAAGQINNAIIVQVGTFSDALVLQSGNRIDGRIVQGANSNNSAGLVQVGNQLTASIGQSSNNNASSVNQNGQEHRAFVQQSGTGTTARRNSVTIVQAGARQDAQVIQTGGPTTATTVPVTGIPGNAEYPQSRAANSVNSAEVIITQRGTNVVSNANTRNLAVVEQLGQGQYAEIDQNGSRNVGRIYQDTGATNAVAILEQTGVGNSYTINQTLAGQYLFVRQDGGSNTIVTGAGATGGGTQAGATPGTPTFTTIGGSGINPNP